MIVVFVDAQTASGISCEGGYVLIVTLGKMKVAFIGKWGEEDWGSASYGIYLVDAEKLHRRNDMQVT